MDRYISVDCGKAETKICVRINSDSSIAKSKFATRVIERFNGDGFESMDATKTGCFKVSYDGHDYAVGNFVTDEDGFTSNNNSKNDIIHKVATLTAIASVVNNGDVVRVVIGCPVGLFSNKANREKYLAALLPKGRVDISVNGAEKHFTITQTFVLPESCGTIYTCDDKFDNKSVGIIDIGGLNINCSVYDNRTLVVESCFTEQLGRKILVENVKKAIETKTETEFHAYEIERFIQQGYITNKDSNYEEESKEFVKEHLKSHIEKIWKVCKAHHWNLDYMNLIFIGGTSIMLRNNIFAEYPKAFIPDEANFINAEGFLRWMCSSLHVM